jgi:hypothetical protein
MIADTIAETELTDRELVLQFESIGDNCEMGFVQRKVGAEPLGMFRFAGVPLDHLLRAMRARFEGMADSANVRVQPENGEYMIKLTKYDFIYHADVKIDQADPEVLRQQQTRTVRFLVDKLIADLENPSKILVFRQNEPLSANDLVDLHGGGRLRTLRPSLGTRSSAWPSTGHRGRCRRYLDDRPRQPISDSRERTRPRSSFVADYAAKGLRYASDTGDLIGRSRVTSNAAHCPAPASTHRHRVWQGRQCSGPNRLWLVWSGKRFHLVDRRP